VIPLKKRLQYLLPYVVSLWLVSACGGNPAAPEDIEKQAFDDMRAEVQGIVDNSEREATLVGLVDQLEADYAELRTRTESRRHRIRELNANYDASMEEFEALLAEVDGQLGQSRRKFTESHRSFVEATTPDEWSAIGKSNTKSMAKLAHTLMSI